MNWNIIYSVQFLLLPLNALRVIINLPWTNNEKNAHLPDKLSGKNNR